MFNDHAASKPHVFRAVYDYGLESQQIKKLPLLTRVVNEIAVRILKPFIFYGASVFKSYWIDPARQAADKKYLEEMGAQSVELKTPDGDKLDGMHLSAHDFKKYL